MQSRHIPPTSRDSRFSAALEVIGIRWAQAIVLTYYDDEKNLESLFSQSCDFYARTCVPVLARLGKQQLIRTEGYRPGVEEILHRTPPTFSPPLDTILQKVA